MDENERLYNQAVMLWGQSNNGEKIELAKQSKAALEKIEDDYEKERVDSLLASINRVLENHRS